MNTLMITQCKNGYFLRLVDENSNELDTRIASNNNARGYGDDSLVTAIESIFKDNKPDAAKTTQVLSAWGMPLQDGTAAPDAISEPEDKTPF